MLAVTRLAYAYGRTPILKQVDLTIAAGEIVCLIGPNGAGKSTLLKCIVGILRADPDRIELFGRPVEQYRRRERARAIAYVPQHGGSALGLNVADMIALGRAPHRGRSTRTRDREIVSTAIERFGLAPLAFRPFTALSGGQRQRVLIARAFAQESQLVLMDEPTSNLDPFYQMETLAIIRSIATDEGKAMLVTLHDLSMAARLADRIALMDQGEIVVSGPWREVLTPGNIAQVYGVSAIVGTHDGLPYIITHNRSLPDPQADMKT